LIEHSLELAYSAFHISLQENSMISTAFRRAVPRVARDFLTFFALLPLAATLSCRTADAVRPNTEPCGGVGYLAARFVGKPNPWPNNEPLQPNEKLLEAYIARYGQPPGSGGKRYGYCCELFGLNYTALLNAANHGGTGPGGETLHPGNCVTTTEATDLSFTAPRGGPYIGQWVVAFQEGGTPQNPVILHDKTRECGPFSVPRSMYNAYTIYFDNQPPCGSTRKPKRR